MFGTSYVESQLFSVEVKSNISGKADFLRVHLTLRVTARYFGLATAVI